MANGGVYDQLAGGFHRYSVDEHWIVPHFEKMSYDNSELLKNYVHAYQATGAEFFAEVARDIIRWMDEWLSDRERAASTPRKTPIFPWTTTATISPGRWKKRGRYLMEMNSKSYLCTTTSRKSARCTIIPAKNVLYIRASVEDIGRRLKMTAEQVEQVLASARQKMYAARLQRPTPYVDKTVYTGWNALSISAYLEAAKGLAARRRSQIRSALAGSHPQRSLEPADWPEACHRLFRSRSRPS